MKTGKPRILYLPRWYPNRRDPMPGLFIRRHAMSVKDYADIAVLYVHLNFERDTPTYETVVSEEFDIHEVSVYYRASHTNIAFLDSIINLIRFFRAHQIGFQKLKKNNWHPDLIHVNVLTRCGIIALFEKFSKGTPYVITEHWTRYLPGMDNYKGFLRKWLTKRIVRNASAVLPVTQNLQRAMELHGLTNKHYHVIPNVVDINMFKPAKQKNELQSKMILHVSCFDDNQKNISGILRVLKRLAAKRQDWYCTMVGEGIHYNKLVRLAEEMHLKDRFVYFTGLRENEELSELMQQADFQLMFSRYENLPVVIPESFACGVPFLSTNVGGIAEHIHLSLGRLVPSEDEDALLREVEFMLDHPAEFDKQQIRQYALDHFSQEVIGRQIWEVYQEVLSAK
ncbi:MAG: glycosyltransferase [Bacteroidales bacterium]|nr:glycosyltransferase [Bacteroidales bacterium]